MFNKIAVVLSAAALAGCSLAPPYVRPEAPVASAYPASAGPESGNAAGIGWRELFPDPRLQGLVANALAENRDLRVAAARIQEARALYNIQAAERLPTINATAAAARAREPAISSPTRSPLVGSAYQVGLSLAAFELDFFGRVRNLTQAALAQYLSTAEAHQSVEISLVSEVAKAYLAERGFAEQRELAQKTLESRQTELALTKRRFDAGTASSLELVQNETLVQSARASLAELTRQHGQAVNALTLLVGKPLPALPPPRQLSEQNIITEIPAGLPSDLLARRPDIRAAEQRLLAANANIGAARAAFFPSISLTGSLGSASNALSGLFDAGSGLWSFGPQLVLPIFDAGRNIGNLDLAHARNNIAVADYERTIQAAFREVADTLVARGPLDEQLDAQRALQDAQAERLRLSDLRYKTGVASSLELLDAQRELFAAQQALVQTRLLRLTNTVDLYRSLGGGLTEHGAAPGGPVKR